MSTEDAAEPLTTADIEALRRNCPADKSIARLAATLAERDRDIERVKRMRAELCRELSEEQERCRLLRAELTIVKTDLDGVWLWQGDGYDRLSSLSCPVVMAAPTLRRLLGRAAEDMRERAARLVDDLDMADEPMGKRDLRVAAEIRALPPPEEAPSSTRAT